MNDITGTAAEDRVKAAIAGKRVAELPAFAQAGEVRRSKTPAERPLADIAGDGAGVTNLRRRRFTGGVGENHQFLSNRRVLFNFHQLLQRTDAKCAALFFDVIEARNGL